MNNESELLKLVTQEFIKVMSNFGNALKLDIEKLETEQKEKSKEIISNFNSIQSPCQYLIKISLWRKKKRTRCMERVHFHGNRLFGIANLLGPKHIEYDWLK